MPALDDIRALRASRERRAYEVQDVSDEEEEDVYDDIQEAGALTAEDEELAMQGSAPFSSVPATGTARWEETAPPESSGWSTRNQQALVPLWTAQSDDDAEAFCVRFSPDDTLLAAGCGDGVVRIFHTEGGRLAYRLEACAAGLPTTAIRFRPTSASSKTRNVMLVANSDGTVQHWHITSQRCLHTVTEEDNQVYALDYQHDGARFATAGKDYTVRVYDEATKTCVSRLCGGYNKTSPGHSNRIFSVKFCAHDPHTLLSAGWDNTIQVWDLRTRWSKMRGPRPQSAASAAAGTRAVASAARPRPHQG